MTSEVATAALRKLLARCERVRVRGAASPASLPVTESSFPAYFACRDLASVESLHAQLRSAERAGAIALEWDRRSGEGGQVRRINVVDDDALAAFLGVEPHWTLCERARQALAPWAVRPQVAALLDAWADRRTPRDRGPDRVSDFVDAMKVIEHLERRGQDESLRRVSATLFDDSKRLESLAVELDFLTRSDADAPAREKADLFNELGLLTYGLPFHLAGKQAYATLLHQPAQMVAYPYSAFDPDAVGSVEFAGRYVLSVENYTIFHELSRGTAGTIDGLLLYTAGMPSPAWRRAYQRIAAVASVPLLHWGDTDVGGIRILSKLQETATAVGRNVEPWRMGQGGAQRKALSTSDVTYLRMLCLRHNWVALAAAIEAAGVAFEQEGQAPALPEAVPSTSGA